MSSVSGVLHVLSNAGFQKQGSTNGMNRGDNQKFRVYDFPGQLDEQALAKMKQAILDEQQFKPRRIHFNLDHLTLDVLTTHKIVKYGPNICLAENADVDAIQINKPKISQSDLEVRLGMSKKRPASTLAIAPPLSSASIDPSPHPTPKKAKQEGVAERLASVDKLPANPSVSSTHFPELIKDSSTYNVKEGFRYKLNDLNPLRATFSPNGIQIMWRAIAPVTAAHVKEVIDFSVKHNRSLHINTGTHGDPQGNTVVQQPAYAEALFSKEDLTSVWNLGNVSVHIVSSLSPAIQKADIDIINAWCFSIESEITPPKSAFETYMGPILALFGLRDKMKDQETPPYLSPHIINMSIHGDVAHSQQAGHDYYDHSSNHTEQHTFSDGAVQIKDGVHNSGSNNPLHIGGSKKKGHR